MIITKTFYDEDTEDYTDVESIILTITDLNGVIIVNEAIPTRTSTGQYSYDFNPATSGEYTAIWHVVINDEDIILNETIIAQEALITTFNAKLISEDNTFKVGNYGETIIYQLLKQENTPIKLDNNVVKLFMNIGGITKELAMEIKDGENGIVNYTFKENDLNTTGLFYIEIELDGKLTSENKNIIRISDKIKN
jgi:hypothetical protein